MWRLDIYEVINAPRRKGGGSWWWKIHLWHCYSSSQTNTLKLAAQTIARFKCWAQKAATASRRAGDGHLTEWRRLSMQHRNLYPGAFDTGCSVGYWHTARQCIRLVCCLLHTVCKVLRHMGTPSQTTRAANRTWLPMGFLNSKNLHLLDISRFTNARSY